MGKFSRYNVSGHVHFVTTKAFHNRPLFRDRKCCEILIDDVVYYRRVLGFKVFGYVIMPDPARPACSFESEPAVRGSEALVERTHPSESKAGRHLHLLIGWDMEQYPDLTISRIMHGIKGLSAKKLLRNLLGSRGVSASTDSQGTKALATQIDINI